MFHATMTFDLGEDTNALRDVVHAWAQERVKPMAAKVDVDNLFPSALWKEMGDLGLLGVTVPEEFGGAGMSYLAHTVAVEEIARASASVCCPTGRIRTFASIRSNLTAPPIKKQSTCPNWYQAITSVRLQCPKQGLGPTSCRCRYGRKNATITTA